MEQIAENIKKIQENISKILKDSGRNDDITLIAVTKTVGVSEINQAILAGIKDVGENKVQEVEKKQDQVCRQVNWHLIGTLQTNKVKNIIDKVNLIHSLDRISLAEEIDKRAKQAGIIVNCLIQVNISKEDSKHGVAEEETENFIKEISSKYENIYIVGLMGMAPLELEPEATRPYFKKLKDIFDKLAEKNLPNVDMKHLSMGMSNDYSVAIEEGSNMIRIGTSIFGERNYNL